MNQLYEFGSSVDVILKVKSNCTIGGKNYVAGQVYTVLKDVAVGFTHMVTSTSMAAKKPIYAGDIENLPDTIRIGNVPVNDKIANLIFGYNAAESFEYTVIEKITATNGQAYLKYPVSRDLILVNGDREALAADSYVINGDLVTVANGTYTATYYTQVNGKVFNLGADYFPYFEIEIAGEGNINKQTRRTYMHFPAVKITQVPNLDLDNEGVFNTPFVGNVIYQGQPRPTVMFED